MFVDLGIRYKLMAEEILQRQIQLVKHNLMEVSLVSYNTPLLLLTDI